MNNSKIAIDTVMQDSEIDRSPIIREQITELTAIIEAIEHINGSNYWKVLEQMIFSADLSILRNRLSKEKDTTEMFRLQGEIARSEKYDLARILSEKRNILANLKKQLHD